MARRAKRSSQRRRQRQRSERKRRRERAREGRRSWVEPGPRRAFCSGEHALPPRLDQPAELRVVWYRNAIRLLGGEPVGESGEIAHDLSDLTMQYFDLGGRGRMLKDYFSPPLELPDPSSVPRDAIDGVLSSWLRRLEGLGIDVLCCDHLSAAEVLAELRVILAEEAEPPPEDGAIVIDASWCCPECKRIWRFEGERTDDSAA